MQFPGLAAPPQQRPPYPQQRGNVGSAAQMMGALSLQQPSQEAHAAAFMQPGMHYPGMHPGMHMAGYPGMPMQMAFVPGPGGVPQGMHQIQVQPSVPNPSFPKPHVHSVPGAIDVPQVHEPS